MSTTQQSSKRYLREEELSRGEMGGSEPAQSRKRSKTSLKSPQRIVGIKDRSWSGGPQRIGPVQGCS